MLSFIYLTIPWLFQNNNMYPLYITSKYRWISIIAVDVFLSHYAFKMAWFFCSLTGPCQTIQMAIGVFSNQAQLSVTEVTCNILHPCTLWQDNIRNVSLRARTYPIFSDVILHQLPKYVNFRYCCMYLAERVMIFFCYFSDRCVVSYVTTCPIFPV